MRVIHPIKDKKVFLQTWITADEYDNLCKEWDQELDKLETEIIEHSRAHKEFAIALSTLLDIASRANELFEISKPEQKRQLVNFIFSNLKLEGQNLVFNLKMPFNQMALLAKSENWLPLVSAFRNKYYQEILELGKELELLKKTFALNLPSFT